MDRAASTLARVEPISPEKATPEIKEIFEKLQKKLGRIPNIFLHMGNSPAALKAYFAMEELANQTSFNPKLRESIALAVAEANQCHYCLSAHTAIGKNLGLTDQEALLARKGDAKDKKEKAILQFAKKIVEKRGILSDDEVTPLKKCGVTDKELVDLIFLVNLNMYTNYFNHIIETPNDFPKV